MPPWLTRRDREALKFKFSYKLFKLKKIIFPGFFVTAALLFSITAWAQKMGDAAERSAKLTEWMRINLNLTDEQLPTVRDINLKYAKKMDALKTN